MHASNRAAQGTTCLPVAAQSLTWAGGLLISPVCASEISKIKLPVCPLRVFLIDSLFRVNVITHRELLKLLSFLSS